jgi:arginyl-tRNA synthetase
MNVLQLLERKLRAALDGLVDEPGAYAGLVKATQDPKHGDYQANCAMPLAKLLGRKPTDVARDVVARLDLGDELLPPEVAGPGFINLRLRDDWLARQMTLLAKDERLGVAKAEPKTIVVDYSGPNVAKPMHVGHLRSTIIGDALTRLFRFLGHTVIADNHLGDWGTQFGILLYGYKHFLDEQAFAADPVRELARLYVHVRSLFVKASDEDLEAPADPVAAACREETAKLHAGDSENLRLWRLFMPYCYEEIAHIYQRLDVHFDHQHGESFYHPMLADVVRSLEEKGIARASNGAVAIFFGEEETPALVRKRDGAYTYTTTDLATIRYRMEQWRPNAMLYVVDFRQGLHFKHLFDSARRWGYDAVDLEHISFGSVLGRDRKPLRTRDGGVPELDELLNEAVARAAVVYEQNRQIRNDESETPGAEELRRIYEVVGVGAVKYADLSQNRTTDYIFDLEKMTATDGNTATYMQYAYARNRAIIRKSEMDVTVFRTDPPTSTLNSPEERALAVQLLRFENALLFAAAEYKPSHITAYLWDLAKTYSGFFQNCPVLKAETPELRVGRLLLCDLTARVIQRGLDLLGIRTLERM